MPHTISVLNQKGGVAKTITVAHLAVALAERGKTVLCIDMDPQANLAMVLGNLEAGQKPQTTVFDALAPESTISLGATYLDTKEPNVKLCYGSLKMAGLERQLISVLSLDPSRVLLKKIDAHIREDFDYVLIDCPPSLSLLTTNALGASDFFIVPVGAGDALALEGVDQLNLTINTVRSQLNSDLQLLGVLLTRWDGRLNIAKSILNELERIFGTKNIFETKISSNTAIEQATYQRKTVFESQRSAVGARDYIRLGAEVERRCDILTQSLGIGNLHELDGEVLERA